MLQGLEAADGHAELAPRLEVGERRFIGVADGAHGFGAEQGSGIIHYLVEEGEAIALGADERLPGDGCAGELDVDGSQVIDRAIFLYRHAGGAALDEKEADAVWVRGTARRARWDHQQVGAAAVEHGTLVAVEDPAIPRPPRPCSDVL